MICKDCIHDEMCQKHNNLVQIDEHTWDEYILIDEVEKFCEHFKNKADVVEVKHGKWNSLTECANAGVYCSVCHKKVYKEDYAWCNKRNKLRSDYCPNCGAKMDGGKM